MTKGEAINGALRWMDEATVGGQTADNDEIADLRNRMATLLDGVVAFLGSQFRPEGIFSVNAQGGWQEIELPADCVFPRDLLLVQANNAIAWPHRRWIGNRKVWVLGGNSGVYKIIYDRRPTRVADTAPDSTVLDCTADAETLIPLKLAADVLAGMPEKAALGAFLEDKFSAMLKSMLPPERAEAIRSVYGVTECL